MIKVFDLSTTDPEEIMLFSSGVSAEWAVRYAYAESVGKLTNLLTMKNDIDIDSRFPITRGKKSVCCGNFLALYERCDDD